MAPLRTVDADSEVRHRPKGSGGAAAAPRTDPFLLDGDSRCRRSPRELLGGRSFAAVLVYFAALTALALYVHGREPAALGLRDAAARPGTFVEERARGHLRALTAFGPRPTGSYANEVLAVEYLARQAHLVRQRADPAHAVEVDVQRVSGSFNLDFQDGFTSAYGRVRNVLVRLAPSRGANHSVMVNCHFDSVPGSPGFCLTFWFNMFALSATNDGLWVLQVGVVGPNTTLDPNPKMSIWRLNNHQNPKWEFAQLPFPLVNGTQIVFEGIEGLRTLVTPERAQLRDGDCYFDTDDLCGWKASSSVTGSTTWTLANTWDAPNTVNDHTFGAKKRGFAHYNPVGLPNSLQAILQSPVIKLTNTSVGACFSFWFLAAGDHPDATLIVSDRPNQNVGTHEVLRIKASDYLWDANNPQWKFG